MRIDVMVKGPVKAPGPGYIGRNCIGSLLVAMVRGAAKAQAQAKAQKKVDSMNKHGSQLEDQKKGLKLMCPTCKV